MLGQRKLNPLISWFVSAGALLAGDQLLPAVHVDGLVTALVGALVLGVVNMFVRPVLFVLTLPATILTFGLFTFVLNAIMLAIAAWMVEGFAIRGVVDGLALALLVAIAHAVAFTAFGRKRK